MEKPIVKSKDDIAKFLAEKSEFERDVLLAAFDIPKGKVSTYKRIAEKIGRPRAYRAAGNALRKNPLAPIVPCHRVVRSDGTIAGSEENVETRRLLLEEEGVSLEGNRVKLSKEILF
ncbi:MAG: MGMT family protein [Candidatus Bathyarchaeia archaeon]